MFLKCPNTNNLCHCTESEDKTKEMECSKSLDHFVSVKKRKKKAVVPYNKKARGVDSAFRDKHTMHLMGTRVGLVT